MNHISPKVKKSVLIIDDMYKDYKQVSEAFKNYHWKIYPEEDDYIKKWNKIYLDKSSDEITMFIEKYLKKIYRQIGVIILDIWLVRSDNLDQTGIDKVLPMIRNLEVNDAEFKEWGAKVPIIALTRIPPREMDRIKSKIPHRKELVRVALAGQEYADAFFRKDRFLDEPNLLVFTAHSLLSTFRLRMQEGLDGVMSDKIDALFEYLEKDKKAVISKMEDIEIILKGGFDAVDNQLRLILNALFLQMKDEYKKKIMQQFSLELKHALGDKQFKKIEQELEKPSLKEDFKKCIKKGTMAEFSAFLTNAYDELAKTGVLSAIPLVKFIGLGLTTILKIMSK